MEDEHTLSVPPSQRAKVRPSGFNRQNGRMGEDVPTTVGAVRTSHLAVQRREPSLVRTLGGAKARHLVPGVRRFLEPRYGGTFRRVGWKVGGSLEVVDVADHQTREEARTMGAPGDLEALFEKL